MFLLNSIFGFVIFFSSNSKVVIVLGFVLLYSSGKVMIVMSIICFFGYLCLYAYKIWSLVWAELTMLKRKLHKLIFSLLSGTPWNISCLSKFSIIEDFFSIKKVSFLTKLSMTTDDLASVESSKG